MNLIEDVLDLSSESRTSSSLLLPQLCEEKSELVHVNSKSWGMSATKYLFHGIPRFEDED